MDGKYELTEKQKRYLPVKRAMDIVLAGGASIVLAPVMGIIALAIKIDSPGPVFFKQKRVGKNKELFEIWKFRTMRTDTPKDMPTHMLNNPEQYITKVGRFLRKTSLDELPQIWQIFLGSLSWIGPRPALWNQDDLVAERDKYGVNEITPGLTGWAQINGRDELEIPVKARFDGEYVEKMGFGMDVKCFFGTIGSVLSSDGVVEGGTGEMRKKGEQTGDGSEAVVSPNKVRKQIRIGVAVVGMTVAIGIGALRSIYKQVSGKKEKSRRSHSGLKVYAGMAIMGGILGCLYKRSQNRVGIYKALCTCEELKEKDSPSTLGAESKKILITGIDSYIGRSVEAWLNKSPDLYLIDTIDMVSDTWKECDFSKYAVVFHVAGIAHADVGSVTEEQKQLYYKVNTDLAVEVAKRAKESGVKQFIFMSSMIVYSGCRDKIITATTRPKPLNFYGDSKWQAEQKIRKLEDETFKVVVLRPPVIYGKNSKGNYSLLAKMASKVPVFPDVKNKRSMLYIENLCQFVKLMIDNEETGVFFPQNSEYVSTSEMVQMIAAVKGHTIIMIPGISMLVKLMEKIPGKIGGMTEKAFGDFVYDMSMSEYKENYRVKTFAESIGVTEGD